MTCPKSSNWEVVELGFIRTSGQVLCLFAFRHHSVQYTTEGHVSRWLVTYVSTHRITTQIKVSVTSSIPEGSFVPPPSQHTPTEFLSILQILVCFFVGLGVTFLGPGHFLTQLSCKDDMAQHLAGTQQETLALWRVKRGAVNNAGTTGVNRGCPSFTFSTWPW